MNECASEKIDFYDFSLESLAYIDNIQMKIISTSVEKIPSPRRREEWIDYLMTKVYRYEPKNDSFICEWMDDSGHPIRLEGKRKKGVEKMKSFHMLRETAESIMELPIDPACSCSICEWKRLNGGEYTSG